MNSAPDLNTGSVGSVTPEQKQLYETRVMSCDVWDALGLWQIEQALPLALALCRGGWISGQAIT